MCPPYFDNLTCWPSTPAGTVATLGCSKHIHGFTNYVSQEKSKTKFAVKKFYYTLLKNKDSTNV